MRVTGFAMPPFMGLTSWASFIDGGKAEAMNPHEPWSRR